MKKILYFIITLGVKIGENEILPLAAGLTYRLIFALFPFLIFLISLVGFFNIDANHLIAEISEVLPLQMAEVITGVVHETVDTRSTGLLSVSLVITLFTAANGFRAVMRGINKVYDRVDDRGIIKRWLSCAVMVLVLAAAIISSLLVIIYGDIIHAALARFFSTGTVFGMLFGFAGMLLTITIMLAAIILIYKLSSPRKRQPVIALLPGAMLTMLVWAVSSGLFNTFINNFSRYPLIYGSLASIFITMLWLNIISATILIGAQVNALLNIRGKSARK